MATKKAVAANSNTVSDLMQGVSPGHRKEAPKKAAPKKSAAKKSAPKKSGR